MVNERFANKHYHIKKLGTIVLDQNNKHIPLADKNKCNKIAVMHKNKYNGKI